MADKQAPQNRPNKGRFVKGDQRINKGGRPKNEVSLTAIARRFIGMAPSEIAGEVEALRARYSKLGRGPSSMGELIMASFLLSLVSDPQPGNMRELWRRIDGEVAQVMEHASDPARPVTIKVIYGTDGEPAAPALEASRVLAASGQTESSGGGPAGGEDDGSSDVGG